MCVLCPWRKERHGGSGGAVAAAVQSSAVRPGAVCIAECHCLDPASTLGGNAALRTSPGCQAPMVWAPTYATCSYEVVGSGEGRCQRVGQGVSMRRFASRTMQRIACSPCWRRCTPHHPRHARSAPPHTHTSPPTWSMIGRPQLKLSRLGELGRVYSLPALLTVPMFTLLLLPVTQNM